MKKVMIVAPHPDDAELAMGGTIVKMLEADWEVVVIDLTDGEPTPYGSKQIRQKETQKANQILGIKNRICLEMPNRYLQATLENRRKLAEAIRLWQPDLLFAPVMPDHHPDHTEAAKLIAGARFEARFHKTSMKGRPHWVGRRYDYYSSQRSQYNKPSFIVDITDCWHKKLAAIKAYQSQTRNRPAATAASILEQTEVVCRYFGQCIGAGYGEPFVASEPIGIRKVDFLTDTC